MKRGFARFWYKFKNRYFRKVPGPGEPLTFLCGSEEELRRVTTWTLHSIPACFENGISYITAVYYANTHTKTGFYRGGLSHLNSPHSRYPTIVEEKWLSLIFRYNTFAGTQWLKISHFDRRVFREASSVIQIKVTAPSAHERAEALLALSEWLDGKVSEEEKRELMQLPDDVEV